MRNLPEVTKNLLLINVAVYVLGLLIERYGIDLTRWLGLWSVNSGRFGLWQLVSYMFLHANFGHLFCNMFAVLMFGPALEQSWGAKKYLLYYFVCGIGAALVQLGIWALVQPYAPGVTIGASGAVFGILLAFGWLFPDVPMFLLFIPIPIRARVFVIGYAVVELFAGIVNIDNVAHFAHLGGMLFGLLLILWWKYSDHWHWPRFGRKHTEEYDTSHRKWHYQQRV